MDFGKLASNSEQRETPIESLVPVILDSGNNVGIVGVLINSCFHEKRQGKW